MSTYAVMPFITNSGIGEAIGNVGTNALVPTQVQPIGLTLRSSFGTLVAWWNGNHAPITSGQLWPRGGLG